MSYLCTRRHNVVLTHFTVTAVLFMTKITLLLAQENNVFKEATVMKFSWCLVEFNNKVINQKVGI